MGTAAASAGAAGPFQGLRAGRSSGRTKQEYPAAGGRRDQATFGSGPMRQSDERDSEPDYLLRPTRHGPCDTLLDCSAFPFSAQVTVQRLGFEAIQEGAQRHLLSKDTLHLNQEQKSPQLLLWSPF